MRHVRRIAAVVGLVLVAATALWGLAGPVGVVSGSMLPTLASGDLVFLNRAAYGLAGVAWSEPRAGEVVVFTLEEPSRPSPVLYIKRVVAVAGDVVEVRGHRLTVNGVPAQYTARGLLRHRETLSGRTHEVLLGAPERTRAGILAAQTPAGSASPLPPSSAAVGATARPAGAASDFGPVTVAPGTVFVLGDDRPASVDSRSFGAVALERIRGRAHTILAPSGTAQAPSFARL